MSPEERRDDYFSLKPTIEHLQTDVARLERTIDRLTKTVTELDRTLLQISPRIDTLEKRERPCPWFADHVERHKEVELDRKAADIRNKERWWSVTLRIVASVIVWTLTALMGAYIATNWGAK